MEKQQVQEKKEEEESPKEEEIFVEAKKVKLVLGLAKIEESEEA